MASSSSPAPSSQYPKPHDIFVSFRGEDTRGCFTSHLCDALRRSKIETFVDDGIEKGDEVWPSLEKAIEDSTLCLVIFSENYASSTWCLKELTKILECSKNQGHLVVPVFYKVDPSHVRKQSESYQKAFEELEGKGITKRLLHQWRKALAEAAGISGFPIANRVNEADKIKEIVESVKERLHKRYPSEYNREDLIGIEERMKDVESLLDKGSKDIRIICIWGMGGLGKTTLAEALYKKWHFEYEGSVFVEKVGEKSKKDGIDALRKELVCSLLGDKAIYSHTMTRLRRKKVFIVLDDVDDVEQLENLVGRFEFGSGSKVLITTRDKQVLRKKVDDIYVLHGLDPHEAFQLFSLNAFKKGYSDPKMRGLAEQVTEYAGGNPLALKVLGLFLCGKKQEAWKSQLEKLQKLPCPKVNDILRLSFEGLDDEEEKNIFLHIACFFNYYYDVENVKKWLDACGYSTEIGLRRLEDKALLDIDRGKICMHGLIKQMGKQIVREESLKYSTWCNIFWIFKKSSEILKKNMGSIEGMIMDLSEVEETGVIIRAFRSMPNLKFLRVYGNLNVQLRNKLNAFGIMFFSKNLMLLDWVGCPLKTLSTTFKGENLVEINLPYSKLTKLWDGEQNLVNLSKINLCGSEDLIELPNFSKAIHLAEVNLACCTKLQNVYPSILSLHSLCNLLLRDCKTLTSLVSNTHLKSLSELSLTGCSGLSEFSVTSEKLLFILVLSDATINGELCSSSGHLSKIVVLNLGRCEGVTSLHKLVDMRTLRYLDADYCNKLASNLCSKFDETRAWSFLRLTNCSELYEVPDNISLLSSLTHLDLSGSNIETLPLSIKHLSSLHSLTLNGCKRLLSLPQLPPSISQLYVNDCLSLETLHLPLMSEDREGHQFSRENFSLINCMKLDGQSIKAIEARVLLAINNNKAIYLWAKMEYPGRRVAEWVMYRTTQPFLTVDLSSIPQPWDGAFIFCAVISGSSRCTNITAKLFIDGQHASTFAHCSLGESLLSDHVVLWYDQMPCREVQSKIEEKKIEAQSNTYHPLLQFEFAAFSLDETTVVIKEWGVCPTSAVEYQNYIKQIQLALLHCKSASRKRKYHSLLR
ncbi:disease resistance-like protein DSC1 [Neltuma alba]|uniref:disease resistance-like protein DSC1 n=1 Tax=Neltuma alba TaxID=207710 RepID=UPI0010A40423|nr:disease resistance-like protein DSC1 [Prosopis alba]